MSRFSVSVVVLCAIWLLCKAAAVRAEPPYNIDWSRQFGTSADDATPAVAVAASGNAFVTGYTTGSLGGPNAGNSDAFLTKYDSSGSLQWIRQVGTSGFDQSYGAAVDSSGNAFITGYTYGSLGGPSAGNADAFLTKYDGAGTLLWSRQVGTPAYDITYGVAADSSGNAYISGFTDGGSLGGPNAGAQDAFLTKYDASGNLLWSRQLGTSTRDEARGVAVDGSGNVYIGGLTQGSLAAPNAGNIDTFLAKYDSAGTLLWSRQLGTVDFDLGLGVAVDSSGNPYLTGWTSGSLGGPTAGGIDAFVTKYDGTGNLLWSRQVGTSGTDQSYGVAVDGSGNAFISGSTDGSLGGPSAGNADAFLTKYDSAGNLLWSRQIGTSTYDETHGVGVDGPGNVFISGFTSGNIGAPNAGNTDTFLVKYAVPEPSSFLLAGLGATGAAILLRRRKNAGGL